MSRAQLAGTGLGSHAIEGWVRTGHLVRLHRGVYRLALMEVARPAHMRAMAALVACGVDAAVVSHRSAGELWGLLAPTPTPAAVHVTTTRRVRRGGIVEHSSTTLSPKDVTRHEGIAITTPSRTLVDLAADLGARALERAFATAERAGLVNRAGVAAALSRHPRARGRAVLRRLCDSGDLAFVRSEAEERLLTLLRAGGLPEPQVNRQVEGFEVDFLWRRQRLVAEVDGYAFHRGRRRFEDDRRRDAHLQAAGFRTTRVTWDQLTGEPNRVLVRLAQMLVWGEPPR